MRTKRLDLFLLLLLTVIPLQAVGISQETRSRWLGISLGRGFQNGLQVQYHHQNLFLVASYHARLLSWQSLSLEWTLMPQFNFSRYKVTNNSREVLGGFEAGVLPGAIIRWSLPDETFHLFFLAGVGPHYVSGLPDRQAAGFIFSDNLMLGCGVRLPADYILDFYGGFRHLSNAGIRQPNGGINSLMLFIGIRKPM